MHGMNGKRTALITGANTGIGLETARQLGQRGMTVLVGARDGERGARAVEHRRAICMTTKAKFSTRADGQLDGALCEPSGSGKTGALVVVHEGYGLTGATKLHCEHFAQAGFLALAPDLFRGKVAKNDDEMAKIMGTFDFQKAVGEIGEAVAHLRSHPRCDGRVAVAGFSLGGALTLAAARYVPALQAAVPFYGLPRFPSDEFTNVKTPICGHYARVDAWAKLSVVEEIQGKVRSGGGQMEVYIYDAEHGFMRSTDRSKYEPKSAELAWQRTVDFLRTHIG
jgi:carboxymethylenebutenolidase